MASGSASCKSPATGTSCATAGGTCVLPGAPCAKQAASSAQDCNPPPENPSGAFCCLALAEAGVTGAASDGGVDAGVSNDASAATDAACTPVLASAYDQSCDADTDCVAISQGASCDWCALSCTSAAINREALSQYTSDTANLLEVAYQQCLSSCGGPTSTCCVGGTCQWSHYTTCPYPGTPATDAAVGVVDAGAE
jgi:hypothetical protein